MNPRLSRIARVAVLLVAAVAVVLLAEFLISFGTYSETGLSWEYLAPDGLGMGVGNRLTARDASVSGLWPIERGDTVTGVVVVSSAARRYLEEQR